MTEKKSFCVKLCVLLASVLFVAMLSGCGNSNLEKYADDISELRENLFAAENADYKITAISGKREDPYEMDGVSAGKRDFTVITVTPAVFSAAKSYRYRTEIGGTVYEGDLLPHPFAQSLSVDIPATVQSDFTLTVFDGGEHAFEMKSAVTGEIISAEKAFTIALDKLKNELKRFRGKGSPDPEIYIRLVENPIDGSGGYFWYVAFVGENKNTVAVLLRADTGAVSAVRV